MPLVNIHIDSFSSKLPVKRDTYSVNASHFIYYTLLFLSVVLYFYYADLAHDYEEYISFFERIRKYNFADLFIFERFEPLFLILTWLLSLIITPQQTYYAITIFILLTKYYIWNNFCERKNRLFILVIYFPIFAFIIDVNQIRAGISSIFLFYIILASPSTRLIVIATIFATFFHYSGIICLLSLFRHKSFKQIFFTAVTVSFAFLILYYSGSLNLPMIAMYLLSQNLDNLTLFSIVSVSYLFIAFLVAKNWKKLHGTRKIGAIYIIFGISFYYLPIPSITAYRIAEMSLFGIIPFLATFNKKSKLDIFMLLPITVIVINYTINILGRTGFF